MRSLGIVGDGRTLISFTAALAAATCILGAGAVFAETSGPAYLIHGGDQLSVQVFGDEKLSQAVTVLPNGDIFYPPVGRVHVGGHTPDQAAGLIGTALKKYVRNPIVTVSVVSQGQLSILVLGNVKNPGKYSVPSNSRVSDALAAAGGLGPVNGDFPPARVLDAFGNVQQVSLQKLLRDGDTSVDMTITSGTSIYVPAPITFDVEVLGSVERPGEIQLREGDRLSMAIAKAGASGSLNPDLNHIRVKRMSPDGKSLSFEVNLFRELEGGDPSKEFVMKKGDVVYVPQGKKPLGPQLSGIGGLLYILRTLAPVGL